MKIDVKKLAEAMNSDATKAISFAKSLRAYSDVALLADSPQVTEAEIAAAKNAFGRIRSLEQASGINIVARLDDEELIEALDELITWSCDKVSASF